MWDLIVSVPDHCLSFDFSNDITYHCFGHFVCCFMFKTMGQIFQRTETFGFV